MIKRNYPLMLLPLIVALVAVACSSQQPEPQPPVEAEEEAEAEEAPAEEAAAEEEAEPEMPALPDIGTINVGYIPITGFAPFFVASELGYFEDEGLDINFELFRSGDPMIAPLAQGQLDVGGGETGPALFNAIDQDFDVRVVGSLASQREGHGGVPLLVRTDLLESGEVSSVADLAGRKVAINIGGGMAEYLLAEALGQAGLTVDDVELIFIPFPEIPQALANASVDAGVLPHPLAGSALRPGEDSGPPAGVLLPGEKLSDTNPQNGVIYFGQRLLEPENREVGVRFLIAYLRAARDFVDDDAWRQNDDIVNAFIEFTSVPEPAIRNGVSYYFDPNGQINTASTADVIQYHFDRGYTDLSEPISLEALILNDFLDEALARLGEYEG